MSMGALMELAQQSAVLPIRSWEAGRSRSWLRAFGGAMGLRLPAVPARASCFLALSVLLAAARGPSREFRAFAARFVRRTCPQCVVRIRGVGWRGKFRWVWESTKPGRATRPPKIPNVVATARIRERRATWRCGRVAMKWVPSPRKYGAPSRHNDRGLALHCRGRGRTGGG